jgi:hypothetical protein
MKPVANADSMEILLHRALRTRISSWDFMIQIAVRDGWFGSLRGSLQRH